MMEKSKKHNIYFLGGIPAAASTFEFEIYIKESGEEIKSGYKQIEYIKAAMNVFDKLKLREHEHFLGFSLWGLSTYMAYPPHSGNVFYPNSPTKDVIEYLQKNL